jgi:hypothetical protein
MSAFITSGFGLTVVTQSDGSVSVLAGIPAAEYQGGPATLAAALFASDDASYAPIVIATGVPQSLSPALFASDDAIYLPAIANAAQLLSPTQITDSDTFNAPNVTTTAAAQSLQPPQLASDDAIYSDGLAQTPWVGDSKNPHPQRLRVQTTVSAADMIYAPAAQNILLVLLPQGAVQAADAIYAPAAQNIRPTLAPALIPSDDAVYNFSNTRFATAPFVPADDTIGAADVGWKVFATFTNDLDTAPPIIVHAHNSFQPDVYFDEESVDSYPFFLQQLTGGIPAPPRQGLTGSLAPRRVLTGSLSNTRRVLTGSLSNNKTRRVLTGSLGPRYGNRKR